MMTAEHRIDELNRELAALRFQIGEIRKILTESAAGIEEHLRVPLSVFAWTLDHLKDYRRLLELRIKNGEVEHVAEIEHLNDNIEQLEAIFIAWNKQRKAKADEKNPG